MTLRALHIGPKWPAFRARVMLWVCVAAFLALNQTVRGVTPESPEVKQSIERGLGYLQKAGESEARLGGKCLVGLCFFKNKRPIDHPLIQSGIKACQNSLNESRSENYSQALAVIYLCELESSQPQLRDLAQTYLDGLLKKQKPHGGFGYDGLQTGDTSQTQYGALALWIAANHGHDVPNEAVERLCGWLVRTQDPTGTWGYQGVDPGGYQRVTQGSEQRLSLHVGGAASTYIAADLLGIIRDQQPAAERKLPPALRAVGQEDDKRPDRKQGALKMFDPQIVRTSLADSDKYFAQNYSIQPTEQLHYYLYGLERYQSFRELAAGRAEPEPKWYNEGCTVLLGSQTQDGYWPASGDTPVISTCFAVLFLSRSSQKTVETIVGKFNGDGVLLGGMGLPPNTADITEREGKVVEAPLAGSIDELLALLEKPNPELDQLVDPRTPIVLDSDVTKRAGQITKLRAAVSAGDFNSRLIAVRALGRTRELDNVPVLIYALTDPVSSTNPDLRIVLEADRGLRFFSRKFAGVGLPDQPSPQDIEAAAKAWKAWYKSVRPEAEFLD